MHNGQQTYEKMFNIINHQRNANQNHSEISPIGIRMLTIKKRKKKKQKITSIGEDVEYIKNSYNPIPQKQII